MSNGFSPGSWQDCCLCGLFSGSHMSAHITHHEIAFAPLVGHTVCVQVFGDLCRDGHAKWMVPVGMQRGVIKAFLRLLVTGEPMAGSSLPAAHFSNKTMLVDVSGAGHRPQKEPVLFDTTASVKLSTIFHTFLNSHYMYMVLLPNFAQLGTNCSWDTRWLDQGVKSQCVGWSRIGGGSYFLSTWTALPFHPKSKQKTLHICNIHTQVCFH